MAPTRIPTEGPSTFGGLVKSVMNRSIVIFMPTDTKCYIYIQWHEGCSSPDGKPDDALADLCLKPGAQALRSSSSAGKWLNRGSPKVFRFK
ncbi:hypothetical protein PGT21_030487 [Puccinia graminis f. sp. tritici]|uniref:Uncharacterized protein n=1 Tax=Puccinia graminis f. sp. tritici TaxID=56615 RepID=A0A5B0MNZ8_PUCGR|nr:hypothetical protein PGT21_030487 [Puccinia graminis f. sp. tritici]